MFKGIAVMIWSWICAAIGHAQFSHIPLDNVSISTGSYSHRFTDAFSFTGNVACLSHVPGLSAGVCNERPFLIPDLRRQTFAVAWGMEGSGLGLQLISFNGNDYGEMKWGLAYAHSLGSRIALGMQFNYTSIRVTGYGKENGFSAEVDGQFYPAENLCVGIGIHFPAGKWDETGKESLASVCKMGLGYEASAQVFCFIECIKSEGSPAAVNAAFHYRFAKQFFAGLGLLTESASPYGWGGWAWRSLRIEVMVRHHPQLGFTPGIKLQFDPAPARKEEAADDS